MKILYFLLVPTDERFTALDDAISHAGPLGVCAVFANGLQILLNKDITIAEFHRVAKEHIAIVKTRYAGKRGPWYEQFG